MSGRSLSRAHLALHLSYNGSIVNGMFSAGEGDIQVWDQDGNHLFTYNDFPYPGDIAWSPDSKLIASTGSDNNIHVWEATSGRPTLKFAGNRPIVWSLDGKYLAVSSTLTAVELFDASSGIPTYSFTKHTGQINVVIWSPDGTRIASGGLDNVVLVWQAR